MSDKMREALEWIADEMRSELTDDGASLPQWLVKSWLTRCTEALAEQPAKGETSPENEAERFIQAAIDRAPEPLRRLGEYLTSVLDEDQWKTAEPMLLGAAVQPAQGEAVADAERRAILWEDCTTSASRNCASVMQRSPS